MHIELLRQLNRHALGEPSLIPRALNADEYLCQVPLVIPSVSVV
jgi:hypothetical protein